MKKLTIILVISLLSVLLASNASRAEVVLLMTFDEGSGANVADSSGKGNSGKVEGKIEWVKGKFGNALKFDGATTHITIPKTPSLSKFSETLSAGTWINPAALNGWTNIVEMDGPANKAWKVGFQDAKPVFTTYRVKDHIAKGAIKANEWSHVAYTYDGKMARVYINGKLDSEIAGSGKFDTSTNDTPTLDIGWRGPSKASFLSAALDELWVSTNVLSEAEIQKFMEGAKGVAVEPAGKIATVWGKIKDN